MDEDLQAVLLNHAKWSTHEAFKIFYDSLEKTGKLRKTDLLEIRDERNRNLLHLACLHNHKNEEVASFLVDAGVSFLHCDDSKNKCSALMYACGRGLLSVIQKMYNKVSEGRWISETNGGDNDANSILHYAFGAGMQTYGFIFNQQNYKTCEFLFDKAKHDKNSLNQYNYNGETPLSLALKLGRLDVVKLLVPECRCRCPETFEDLNHLSYCIRYPVYDNIKEIIELTELTDEDLMIGLHIAATISIPKRRTKYDNDSFEIEGTKNNGRIQFRMRWIEHLVPLIRKNTNLIARTSSGNVELLRTSFSQGVDRFTQFFIDNGAECILLQKNKTRYENLIYFSEHDNISTGSLLHAAIQSYLYSNPSYKLECIDDVIKRFGDNLLHERNSDGLSPVQYAVECKKYNLNHQETLIDLSGNSTYFSLYHFTNFELRQAKLVELLISKIVDFDINQVDHEGDTLIMRAVKNENLILISFLRESGADPQKRNDMRKNAYDCAKQTENADLIEKILRKDTGTTRMGTTFILQAEDLIKRVIATKDYINISEADIDVFKKTHLTISKLIRPATIQQKKNAQREVCMATEVKQEIMKENNLKRLKNLLEEKNLLGLDDSSTLEEKACEEVAEILLRILSNTEPEQFDALLQELSKTVSMQREAVDIWSDICFKCAQIVYANVD